MRYRSLDAIRGIAALIVVVYHAVLILPGGLENRVLLRSNGYNASFGWLYLSPLRLFVAGPVAVFVFFVLSGFVLTLSLTEGGRETYRGFFIKRVARIWLPFAVVIVASALLAWAMDHLPLPGGVSHWMRATWSDRPHPGMLARHLAMMGTDVTLDSPMWSLVYEMRISIILPVLVVLIHRRGWATWLTIGVFFLMAIESQSRVKFGEFERSLVNTLCYLPLFLMGIGLALHRTTILTWLQSRSRLVRTTAWLLAIAGLIYGPVTTGTIARIHDGVLLLMNGAAASLLIALSTLDGLSERLLMTRVPQWLGKVSYSLYLVHVVVFAVTLRLLAAWPLWVSISLAGAISLGVAAISQRCLEKPAAGLGRIVAGLLSRPASARSRAVGALERISRIDTR